MKFPIYWILLAAPAFELPSITVSLGATWEFARWRRRGARRLSRLLASATLVNHVVDLNNQIIDAILVHAPIRLKEPYLMKREQF